ncbi:transcriptional regulator with XRE-family HTH domain [Labrenzia sp. EL_208]|nr:transcriptional regulator with XRE-family HTH domain [Labrenzia sp. EL_132]MBG6233212.1 transcriptional regulator with XRE-family HTH domain [Labrenzia sp. EL_208]
MSQETLAHEADIDRTYVSALERANYAASIDMIGKLAQVLDIDPMLLLQREQ